MLGSILTVALSSVTAKSIFMIPQLFVIVNVQLPRRRCSVSAALVFNLRGETVQFVTVRVFNGSAIFSCLLFFKKTTLKIESLQNVYSLLLISWELFRQKLAIMRKINIMRVVFKLSRVSI